MKKRGEIQKPWRKQTKKTLVKSKPWRKTKNPGENSEENKKKKKKKKKPGENMNPWENKNVGENEILVKAKTQWGKKPW